MQLQNKLISIIVPIYNVEEYLLECLDSIINQSYQNLEIILVNDGSTDNCEQICKSYALLDDRIIIINKKNGGLSDARNAGLDVCKGNYVSFIDSDDVVHKQFIETLVLGLLENEADISFCNFKRFMNSSDLINNHSIIKSRVYNTLDGNYMIDNLYAPHGVNLVVVWNKIYKKDIFKNIRFPKNLVHEDEYVFIDIYKNNPKVTSISEELYFYRVREGSIMNQRFKHKNIYSYLLALNNRITFFKEKKDTKNLKLTVNTKLRYQLSLNKVQPITLKKYIKRSDFVKIIFLSNIKYKKRIKFILNYVFNLNFFP